MGVAASFCAAARCSTGRSRLSCRGGSADAATAHGGGPQALQKAGGGRPGGGGAEAASAAASLRHCRGMPGQVCRHDNKPSVSVQRAACPVCCKKPVQTQALKSRRDDTGLYHLLRRHAFSYWLLAQNETRCYWCCSNFLRGRQAQALEFG